MLERRGRGLLLGPRRVRVLRGEGGVCYLALVGYVLKRRGRGLLLVPSRVLC